MSTHIVTSYKQENAILIVRKAEPYMPPSIKLVATPIKNPLSWKQKIVRFSKEKLVYWFNKTAKEIVRKQIAGILTEKQADQMYKRVRKKFYSLLDKNKK